MKEKKFKSEAQTLTAEYLKQLNPKREPLTVEKYRKLSGLQLTDEGAQQAVDSINKLARVLYDFVKQQNKTKDCLDE